MRSNFRIRYLPANQAWVLSWGDQIVPILDTRFFESREAIVAACENVGMQVSASGHVASAT